MTDATPAWFAQFSEQVMDRLDNLEAASAASSERGRSRSRAPVTRASAAVEDLRQEVEALRMQTNRSQVIAANSAAAIAGRTNAEHYDLGQDLALSKEGHTVLMLRKALSLLPEAGSSDCRTFLRRAINYYQLAHDTTWGIAKDVWNDLSEGQQLEGVDAQTRAMWKLRADMQDLRNQNIQLKTQVQQQRTGRQRQPGRTRTRQRGPGSKSKNSSNHNTNTSTPSNN